MVNFYAPWSLDCQAFAPEYAKAAKILANEGSPIVLAKVDCIAETSLAKANAIKSYPTLKFFKRDPTSKKPIIVKYNGAHNADAILSVVENYKPDPPKIHSHMLRDGPPEVLIPPGLDSPGKKRAIL